MKNGGSAELRTDITPLKVREQVLQGIMDNVADGIILFGLDGKIREANRAAERIFGFSEGEIVGADVLDLFALDKQTEAARVLRSNLERRDAVDSSGAAKIGRASWRESVWQYG